MDSEATRRYLKAVLRCWWLVVLSAFIPAWISYRLASTRPDIYQAEATIIVGQGVFDNPNPDSRELALSNTLASAYAELLTQRSVLEPVIDGMGLERTAEDLTEQIETRIHSGAQLLEIRVVDTSPEAAALIANRLADELIGRSPTSEQRSPEGQMFIGGQLEELEAKIRNTSEEIDSLTASLAELTSAAEIREAEERIEALELVESRYQNTYAQLLSVSHEGSPNELTLFEPAEVPGSPVPQRTKLMVAAAAAAGLGLALSAVALMEYLDTSLRWDLHGGETVLDLPVLGVIPKVSTRGPLQREDVLSPAAEGVRAIRSKLFLMRPDDSFRTLVVTSPGESEGKSFVLANLAVALASGGNRVIVVDGDMRRPSLHELFDRPNLSGLGDVLTGNWLECEEDSSIPLQETDFDNLYLLSAGRHPVDPAALVTSSRFQRLLDSLTKKGDIILIDTPPLVGPPDATVTATRVEGTILVVAAGITNRESARRARDLLREQQGVNLLGLAINRADTGKSYYYYSSASEDEKPRWKRWIWERWRKATVGGGYLTLGEAATKLSISKRQARRWCKEGRLSGTRRWVFWWQVERQAVDRMIGGPLEAKEEETAGAAGDWFYYLFTSIGEAEKPRWKRWIREHIDDGWWERWRKRPLEDGHLTLGEAATKLSISKRQARRWCKEGRLSGTRRWVFWWQVDQEAVARTTDGRVKAKREEETTDAAGDWFYYLFTSVGEAEKPRWKQWISKHVDDGWWKRWRKAPVKDGYLTLGEAATELSISKHQARRWCQKGRLSGTRKWVFWWQVEREAVDRMTGEPLEAKEGETPGATEGWSYYQVTPVGEDEQPRCKQWMKEHIDDGWWTRWIRKHVDDGWWTE